MQDIYPWFFIKKERWSFLALYWLVFALQCGLFLNPDPLGRVLTSSVLHPIPDDTDPYWKELGVNASAYGTTAALLLAAVAGRRVRSLGPKTSARLCQAMFAIGILLSVVPYLIRTFVFNFEITKYQLIIVGMSSVLIGVACQGIILSHLWIGVLFERMSATAVIIQGTGVDMCAMTAGLLQRLVERHVWPAPYVLLIYGVGAVGIGLLASYTLPDDLNGVPSYNSPLSNRSPLQKEKEQTLLENSSRVVNHKIEHRIWSTMRRQIPENGDICKIFMKKKQYLIFLVFFILSFWRTKKCVAMQISPILRSFESSSEEWDFEIFYSFVGLSSVWSLVMGAVLDVYGVSVALFLINVFGIFMTMPYTNAIQIPKRLSFWFVTIGYSISSGCLFSLGSSFNIKYFGAENLGTSQGMLLTIAGVTSLISDGMNTVLLSVLHERREGNVIFNLYQRTMLPLVISMAMFSIVLLFVWETKKNSARLADIENTTPSQQQIRSKSDGQVVRRWLEYVEVPCGLDDDIDDEVVITFIC